MADQNDPNLARLFEIASVLNIKVERFFDDYSPNNDLGEDEIIRLWLRLKTPDARTAALDALRGILSKTVE